MASEAQLRAIKNHQSKLDRIVIYREKGEKEHLQRVAANKGYESIGAYINSLIDEDVKGLLDIGRQERSL